MKITNGQLRKIIREELARSVRLISEGTAPVSAELSDQSGDLLDMWFSLKGITGDHSSYAGDGNTNPPYYGWFKFTSDAKVMYGDDDSTAPSGGWCAEIATPMWAGNPRLTEVEARNDGISISARVRLFGADTGIGEEEGTAPIFLNRSQLLDIGQQLYDDGIASLYVEFGSEVPEWIANKLDGGIELDFVKC